MMMLTLDLNPYFFTLYGFIALCVWYKNWRANKHVRANVFWNKGENYEIYT